MLNLFTDLTANYDVDYLQTCTLPFIPGGPQKGGCFCDNCVRAAAEGGFDLKKAAALLRQDPSSQPEADKWQAFRRKSIAQYYKLMHDGIHGIRRAADLRFNDCFSNPAEWGLDLSQTRPYLDSVRVCDYTEQRGNPELMKNKREWLSKERQALGRDFPIVSAVAVRPKATPELIREGVRIAVECGMNGITLGHYDGAEFPMLRAVREGLKEARVEAPATLPKNA